MKTEESIEKFVDQIINGAGGMNSYEEHEAVIWNEPERVATAKWVIRCLANQQCEGSEYVLNKIMEQRSKNTQIKSKQRVRK